MARAEKEGFVHFFPADIGFTGRNEGKVLSVLRHPKSGGTPRIAEHSDEAFAPILHGDPNHVVLCAGGVAALKRLADADRRGEPPPTVIVLRPDSPVIGLDRLGPNLKAAIAQAARVDSYGFTPDSSYRWLLAKIRGESDPTPTNADNVAEHDPPSTYDPTKQPR